MKCKHENTKIITKDETYPVLGNPITITASVKVCCDCGQELFDYDLDDNNLRMAFGIYNDLYPDNKIVMED